VPILNPINIPTNGPSFNNPNTGNNVNTGNNPNTGNNTTNTDNTTNTNNPTDTNNPATDTNLNTNTTVDACLAIEQNPLTFTEEEKAQLAVLLRKFYLVSSTLKTSEDITTIYSEIDQQKNFISQIEDLTSQCYSQATDAVMFANNWKRHGNPWYAKTTGGNFPYTSDNTGYLDYSQIDGGMTPAGYKVISGYYYGTLSRDTNGGKTGDSCDKFNNFPGYGLSDQINNKKEIYMSHYCGSTGGFLGLFSGSSCYANGNGAGYPGDSLLSNSSSLTNRQPQKTLLESGCKWKDGVILDNTERLLNIW
jgi:hypothetical protein